MKRHLLVAIVCLLFSALTYGQAWDGVSLSEPQLSGTTYTISTPAELAWVAAQNQTFAGYSFIMTASLDLGGQDQVYWLPIGTEAVPFEGDFDGGCLTVKNMSLSNISGRQTDYGLFGVIGQAGHVHNLAIESGNFFFDQKTYVGAIAGRNNGTIDHCFSLARIFVDQTDNVGGLVGANSGTIDHCFQGGYIEYARDNVGGIAGNNSGTITNSYAAGYVRGAGAGAVIGANSGTLTNVFFDQQMGPLLPGKDGLVAGVTAIVQTMLMYDIFSLDDEWLTAENFYPQLQCFAQTSPDASLVAACQVLLNNVDLPIQRAELNSKDLKLGAAQGVAWSSSGEQTSLGKQIIEVSGTNGKVTRPCSTTDVKLTATKGSSSKTMMVSVQGYDPFDPGVIGGNGRVCKGDIFNFHDRDRGGEIRDAQGGRDDDKRRYPYYYYFDKFLLQDLDGDGVMEDTTFVEKIDVGPSDYYKDFMIFANENGHWLYRRYVRDSQCQLEYVQSVGEYLLTVFDYFDAGEVGGEQVVYGSLPQTLTLPSLRDAQGGEGPYFYLWYVSSFDLEGNQLQDSVVLPVSDIEAMKIPTYDFQFTTPGDYYFYRAACDFFCSNKSYSQSEGVMHVKVYEELLPGAIKDSIHASCTTDITGLIEELEIPVGGGGHYEYRWLCNGVPVAGATTATFNLSTFDFESDHTYRFQRQVRDNAAVVEWLTSTNAYVITVSKAISAGRIAHSETTQCLAADATAYQLTINNLQSATGEGELQYRWIVNKLNSNGTETTVKTLDVNSSAFNGEIPLTGINFPVTLLVKRQVQSQTCQQEWATAEDNAILHLGKDKNQNKDVNVCGEELPYIYTYTYADGHKEQVTFNATGETHVMNDLQVDGCALKVTLRCRLWAQPVVDIQPLGNKCQGETQILLHYTVRSGNPDTYRITFGGAAQQAGFETLTGTIDNGPIIINVPENVPVGEYEFYTEFYEREAVNGCAPQKVTHKFNISAQGYIQQKWNDVLFVDNNDQNHNPAGVQDLKFNTYQWYKNGEPIEGATDQMYYEPYGLDGVYSVVLGGVDGNTYYSCDVEVHPQTALNDVQGFTMHPVPVVAGQQFVLTTPLMGKAEILDISGRLVTSLKLVAEQRYNITAPQQAGTYIVRVITEDGKQAFGKLIVK